MERAPKWERRIEPPGAPSPESGSWRDRRILLAVLVGAGGTFRLATDVTVVPEAGRSSFRVAVLDGSTTTVIAESELPVPPLAQGWEFRGSGIWVDHVCEDPFVHWSFGLEAFALQIDDPVELLGTGYGHRVPLGWELDFEAVGELTATGDGGPLTDAGGGYRQLGRLHGVLLGSGDEIDVEGPAVSVHTWGPFHPSIVDLPAAGLAGPGAPALRAAGPALAEVALPGVDDVWWVEGNSGVTARGELLT
ncbi:MAG: hypothetical protein AAF467_06840 [Actinomycetota bacterium]